MKTFVPTPYGNLRVSARRSPFVDDVIVEIGGPILTPSGDPILRGETIDLTYRFDPSEGWIHVWPSGYRRETDGPMSATTREIEGLVDRWLLDHHEEVRAVIVHSLELGIARKRRSLDRALDVARGEVANSEEFLARVRDRL
jgi:hypothetical protein